MKTHTDAQTYTIANRVAKVDGGGGGNKLVHQTGDNYFAPPA
jgi:hypothetical protein